MVTLALTPAPSTWHSKSLIPTVENRGLFLLAGMTSKVIGHL